MTLRLHNTLTKSKDIFTPLNPNEVKIYSCGPTVYDQVHIGNLSAFIIADTLRRVVTANNYSVKHVMNFTDVDDKTIRRSQENYPGMDAMEALKKLTSTYGELFLKDMQTIGNDIESFTFVKATDDQTVEGMKQLVASLHKDGFAYTAEDGVYFSIDAYKKSGKKYGQLVELTDQNTSNERIQNDEYDKDTAHDFALWKVKKAGEPSWEFSLDGIDLTGRPGWHLECSVMSQQGLGVPFDIHTGGIDLTFPHHENEIAQSTAGNTNPTYASVFVHNEHILIDGKKMSKSLNNFYTLQDLIDKDVDPLAFRLLVLQSHYRKPTNFSLENAAAAHNRLKHWRAIAALRHQTYDTLSDDDSNLDDPNVILLLASKQAVINALNDDINTPLALSIIDEAFSQFDGKTPADIHERGLDQLLETIDETLGLQLRKSTPDISDEQKQLIMQRLRAREDKNWTESDRLRDILLEQGVMVRDTTRGVIWEYK